MLKHLFVFGCAWFAISILPHWLLALGVVVTCTDTASRISRLAR